MRLRLYSLQCHRPLHCVWQVEKAILRHFGSHAGTCFTAHPSYHVNLVSAGRFGNGRPHVDVFRLLAQHRVRVRRAMSLQDFNPASATYGSCDRAFGTIGRFRLPAARCSSGRCHSRFLSIRAPGKSGIRSRRCSTSPAAMVFWARMRHPAGSVDEWYRTSTVTAQRIHDVRCREVRRCTSRCHR